MTDGLLSEEIEEFELHLLEDLTIGAIEEWKNLTRTAFGVLSWHLGNFYCYVYGEVAKSPPPRQKGAARNVVLAGWWLKQPSSARIGAWSRRH